VKPYQQQLENIQAPDAAVMRRELLAAERRPLPVGGVGYPAPRERGGEVAPRAGDKYEQYTTQSALAGTGAVFARVARFTGTPDALDIQVFGGDAQLQLRDDIQQYGSTFRMTPGFPYSTNISMREVWAFNVSDAAPTTVQVVGKYVAVRPAVAGQRESDDDADNVSQLGVGYPNPDPVNTY
jgi:hypothetical protein